MTTRKPRVVVTRRLPVAIETRMMELFDVTLNLEDRPLGRDGLKAAVAESEVLVPTLTDAIDADVLAAAGPDFKLVANYGTGVDHIDLAAARDRGLLVTNTPDVLTEDTADMAMALVLAVPRRLVEGDRIMRATDDWGGWSPTWMLGHRIHGKRLGVLGMGRIGQALARRARGFGLAIHYHNRNRLHPEAEEELEATYWDSLDQMLARIDILSVNCPHTPATYHLLNERRLRLMQPHAYIVNTSRGEVIEEPALVRLLEEGNLAGAGLDVFEHEPAVDARLRAMDNVVLLPHMGSATVEARMDMGERVLINIKTWADGHKPPDRVLMERF